MPATKVYRLKVEMHQYDLEAAQHRQARYTIVAQTHVAEVVTGESPLAELAIKLVQVPSVQLEHLTAVEAEVVRRRRDVICLLYTSPSPRDRQKSRMPSSA